MFMGHMMHRKCHCTVHVTIAVAAGAHCCVLKEAAWRRRRRAEAARKQLDAVAQASMVAEIKPDTHYSPYHRIFHRSAGYSAVQSGVVTGLRSSSSKAAARCLWLQQAWWPSWGSPNTHHQHWLRDGLVYSTAHCRAAAVDTIMW